MDNMKIQFPHGEAVELEFGKPVVLLGANGSGKTRFSVKIEEINDPKFRSWNAEESIPIHRISAQKSLSIQDSISILDNDSSKRELFFGGSDQHAVKFNYRFGTHPATFLLDDYNKALSLLFSQENMELQQAHIADKQAILQNEERPAPITTIVEKATSIWNELLPHRKIDLSGNGVHVLFGETRYHGKEMSDGERVILYMICQVLVQRQNTLLIVDEPELHIHKSIVEKLWTMLENERRDCVFMYITHDLSFAMSRIDSSILWIKQYNGTDWDYEILNSSEFSELPEELLYEIIGTRQKIVFVEGEKNSYDNLLYQELYRDKGYHVIACGGCQEVIRLVKAKKVYQKLNSVEVYGIIDRDFRTEQEIEELRKDGIFCLSVAEVENLFLVPELLDIMERVLICPDGTSQKAKDFIKSLFRDNIDNQVALALAQEMKYQLSLFELSGKRQTPKDIKAKIDARFSEERIAEYLADKEAIFNSVAEIPEILKVFNFKDMPKKIGVIFGLRDREEYPQKILRLLRLNYSERDSIMSAMKSYIPDLP